MYDMIERKYVWQLALRVGVGVFILVCIYTSVKSLPLVYVGVATNLSPLLTAVLSYILLKKGLSSVDAIALVASFAGVIILITGASNVTSQS
jgi:drug/metabolite transporter (DMT)-like permease